MNRRWLLMFGTITRLSNVLSVCVYRLNIATMKLFASVLSFLTVVATITTNAQLDCSFRADIELGDGLVLRQIANQEENTYSIELEYEGNAWLAFGSSPEGMVGSTGMCFLVLSTRIAVVLAARSLLLI